MKKAHSVRPQDKPQTKLRIANRRARLTKLFAEGKSVRAAAKVLQAEGHKGASVANVGFDLQALAREAPTKVETARAEAHTELTALKKFIAESDMSDSDTVHGLLAIHDRIARLLGLDAPTKSINANLSSELTPIYTDFLRCSHGLSDDQMAQVFEYMKALPRAQIVVDASYLPPAEEEE
jgi:hypothetical protein